MSLSVRSEGRTPPLTTRVLLLCIVVGLAGCNAKSASESEETSPTAQNAVPVEVVTPTRRPIAASYSGTAALEAQGEAQVVAKTSGVALQVLVEEGQPVRAGQPLVRLDPDRARLAVAQAEAQMRKLENNYRRAQQLVAQQMISANDVDQLKYDLENARAQHRMASLELSYTGVEAPISGVIASRSIKPGNFVQINTPIFRIIDNARLEATLNVPERELATLKAGQPVTVVVDALPGQRFEGVVDRIAPVVDSGSGTFRVVAAFEGGNALQPGMFGRIAIDYDQRPDAMVIPRIALLDDGEPAVYVVRDDKVARVPVVPGYLDGEWLEIREGLQASDRVVTAGKIALRDGSTVQIVGGAPQAAVAAKAEGAGNAQ